MAKYTYAERVTKKVRQVLRYDKRLSEIVNSSTPEIQLDDQFELETVSWNYYGESVIATRTNVVHVLPNRSSSLILYYNGFDGLLQVK